MKSVDLLAAAALTSAVVLAAVPAAVATVEDDSVQVILLTVDALHPDELDEVDDGGNPIAPTLVALRDQGTWWTQARAIMASETLPNHVAMGTGSYAGASGIPGNDGRLEVGDTAVADPDLGLPDARRTTSTFAAIEAQCADLRTVSVLSKEYVWRTFSGEADEEFDQPSFNIPESGHAPESATMPYLLQALQAGPADHVFVNLGDHDRAGHIDTTGAVPDGMDTLTDGPRLAQRAALGQVDTWLQTLVQQLQQSGQWERTVLLLASDHSMQFSIGGDERWNVDVGAALEQVEVDAGREPGSTFLFSDNGGAGFVYLLDPADPDRGALLAAAFDAIGVLAGVEEVLYREPNPADPVGAVLSDVHPDWNLHQTERAGDIVVFALPTHRMGSLADNPLPGNHGHTVTRHSTALVTGGWDGIVQGQVVDASDPDAVDVADDTAALPEQAENVDWAPTVGWLLGVEDPGTAAGGAAQWQGRVLEEAFSRRPGDLACVEAAGGGGEDDGADGAGDPDTEDDGDLAATGGGAVVVGIAAAGLAVALRRRGRTDRTS